MGRKEHISELDGIRGFAVLIVFMYHIISVLNIKEFYIGNINIIPFAMWGHFGVNIFYVLSSFLLFTYFAKIYNKNEELDIKKYVIKRIFRILPVFYLFLIIFITLVNKEFFSIKEIKTILINMFFLQNYIDVPVFNDVAWTLAIELQFYILIPFLYKKIMRFNNITLFMISTIFVFIYRLTIMIILNVDMNMHNRQYYVMCEYNILGCIDNFIIGIILAKLYIKYKNREYSTNLVKIINISRKVRFILPIIIIFLMHNYYYWNNSISKFNVIYFSYFFDITSYFCIATVFILILFTESKVKIIFNNYILRFFGKFSYSIYIWHLFFQARIVNFEYVINSNNLAVKYLKTVILSVLIIIPFSILIYYIVEKPFIKFSQKL